MNGLDMNVAHELRLLGPVENFGFFSLSCFRNYHIVCLWVWFIFNSLLNYSLYHYSQREELNGNCKLP